MKNMPMGSTITKAEVEDEYRDEFMRCYGADLNTTAPLMVFITEFFSNYSRLEKIEHKVISIASQQGDVLEIVTHSLAKEYCAIIGFTDDVNGHALMVLKTPDGLFFVNPSTPEVEPITPGTNVDLVDGGKGHKALRFDGYGAMEFAYIFHC